MEKRKREPIGQFVKRNDFMAKLKAALEDIEQGQSFGVFEGLQVRGNCAVTLSFDGVSVRLAAMDENKFPDKMPFEMHPVIMAAYKKRAEEREAEKEAQLQKPQQTEKGPERKKQK